MNKCMRCMLGLGLVLLMGCNETDQQKKGGPLSDKPAKKDSPTVNPVTVQPQSKPEEGQYCYIKKIYSGEGVTYLEADYIQFLMGEEAVQAAKKQGVAEDAAGGYYILNDNPKIRKLTLADNFEYVPVLTDGPVNLSKTAPLAFLKSRTKDRIFILTLEDNVVTRIKEQFLP